MLYSSLIGSKYEGEDLRGDVKGGLKVGARALLPLFGRGIVST